MRCSKGLLFLLMASITAAQAAPERSPVEFDIPSQPLAAALNSLALQADCQMLFEDSIVADLTAPGVVGRMSPEAALKLLLADTRLEYAEDDAGTIVVRRKAPTPIVRQLARRAPQPATPIAASPVVSPASVVESEPGRLTVALRASYFHPDNDSAAFSIVGPPLTVVQADGIVTTDRLLAELSIEYFFNRNWSGELSTTLPRVFALTLHNDATPTASTQVGTFRHMADVLTLKYNFLSGRDWRPYLGAGIGMTSLYHMNTGPYDLQKTSMGPAVQAGIDMQLAKDWFLNADIKWAEARPDIRFQGHDVSNMRIDPVSIGVGVRYRFGAAISPATSVTSDL